jgi:SAM-dependent methyltransferase
MEPSMNETSRPATWYDDEKREDAMSHGHAPVWHHLISLIGETDLSGASVLDFGCNQGGLLRTLLAERPFAKGLGIDIASHSIARARELSAGLNLDFVVGDSPTPHVEAFDLAISHEVIYLIDDLESHARDMLAALRKGGVYYAVTGCHAGNPDLDAWRKVVEQRTMTRIVDRSIEDYASIFLAAGFTVSARKFGYEGFIPFGHDRWDTSYDNDLAYYRDIKTIFRLQRLT